MRTPPTNTWSRCRFSCQGFCRAGEGWKYYWPIIKLLSTNHFLHLKCIFWFIHEKKKQWFKNATTSNNATVVPQSQFVLLQSFSFRDILSLCKMFYVRKISLKLIFTRVQLENSIILFHMFFFTLTSNQICRGYSKAKTIDWKTQQFYLHYRWPQIYFFRVDACIWRLFVTTLLYSESVKKCKWNHLLCNCDTHDIRT